MTDEKLIARLRDAPADGLGTENLCIAAADRIEALVNEAVLSKAAYEGVSSMLLSVQQDCIKESQRADRLEAALTPFVDHAKHRQVGDPAWRDADAVTIIVSVEELRAVSAALKGAEHE